MTAESFTPSVETTFLPKTNGMVFGERLQARADKGRVFLIHGADPIDPLTIVSEAVLTGDPYIGGELVCTPPVVSGGLEPYGYNYTWLETLRSESNVTPILEFDKGKTMQCYVTVVSADGQVVNSVSNGIGPIVYSPANVTISGQLPASYDVTPFVRHSLTVRASGIHDVSYIWQFRNSDNNGWVNATLENLAIEFPDAEAVVWEVNRDSEPAASAFMFNLVTGPGPTQIRCRVRDTDPDGNFDQKVTTTTLNYV